ncbi:MAG: chromate resistance protein [Actinobacteria bacterium]|nr:chromate resistance protein [Actinomycetota bacterium]
MKWATRVGIHVDRAASAWLIRTFIDPGAEFLYVEDIADVPSDATPFDMIGCDLSHKRNGVTFETILRVNDLLDPVLWRIAQIVHQADVEDDLYDAPKAAGLDTIIRALGLDHTDEQVREITATMLDSLYLHLRRETLGQP